MKKILCLLLVLSLFATMACSCGKDKKDGSPASDSKTESVVDSAEDNKSDAPQNGSEKPEGESDVAIAIDVMGMSPEEAEQALLDAGFTVKVATKNYDDVPEGQVAGIDLTVGEEYEKGTKCFLYISGGKTAAALALEYNQSALVKNRTPRSQGDNSNYEPINYEYMKAVWMSQFDMNDLYCNGTVQRKQDEFTARVKITLSGLKDLGFNTIFVQLRPNGDSIYPSEYYCPSKYVVGIYGTDFTYDPFPIIIEEAHALGLSVHGWINPLRCMDFTQISLINISYGLRQFEQEHMDDYVVKVGTTLWLNPGYEEVRQLIINGAAEIVRYYNVDGVHIDDYFYPSEMDFSYDSKAFYAQTDITSQATFRKESLNALINGIYSAVKAENPKVLFGISPHGNPSVVRGAYADVDTWLSSPGYTDYIMPQLYWGLKHPTSAFDKRYMEWFLLVKQEGVKIIPGMDLANPSGGETAEWRENKDVFKRSIQYAEEVGNCGGFSLFSLQKVIGTVDGARTPTTIEEIDNLLAYTADKVDTPLE